MNKKHILCQEFSRFSCENLLRTRHFYTDSVELKRKEPHPSLSAGSRQRTAGSLSLAKNKKLHYPSVEEGLELYQRTDQLSIVSVWGGAPRVFVKINLHFMRYFVKKLGMLGECELHISNCGLRIWEGM